MRRRAVKSYQAAYIFLLLPPIYIMHISLTYMLVTVMLLSVASADEIVITNFAETTQAPHGKGNLYAPDIIKHRGEFLMFFGGQGKDGHDRIHLATSKDGKKWSQHSVVFAPKGVNHVNDPSVVAIGKQLYMYYTRAGSGVTDTIGLAVSLDGRTWDDSGTVFNPGKPTAWDSLLVGRPSVIYDGKVFRMWYDGRKDLLPGAPDPKAPKTDTSRRFAGYAISKNGKIWIRHPKPVFGEDAGGIDVKKLDDSYIMLIESRDGTKWASSTDGLKWTSHGILHSKEGDKNSPHGHVTPFLFVNDGDIELYYGGAAAPTWDQNTIYRTPINGILLKKQQKKKKNDKIKTP